MRVYYIGIVCVGVIMCIIPASARLRAIEKSIVKLWCLSTELYGVGQKVAPRPKFDDFLKINHKADNFYI